MRGRGAIARGAGLVAVGMTVMNAAAYAYTLLAARLLGPEGYSAVAALMGVVLVVNVLALGVQRMAGHDAIVKRLLSVETLGSASVGSVCQSPSPRRARRFSASITNGRLPTIDRVARSTPSGVV